MDLSSAQWLIDNIPARALETGEILAIFGILSLFVMGYRIHKAEFKKIREELRKELTAMAVLAEEAKKEADKAYAPIALKEDVQELKTQMEAVRKDISSGFLEMQRSITSFAGNIMQALSNR